MSWKIRWISKNAIESITSRIDQAEEIICELEERTIEIIQSEENKEKRMKKNEESLFALLDSIQINNVLIIGISEVEESESGMKRIFKEIMA